jgi:hypothetical protein
MISRGGDDDLISRVAMKFTRQTTGIGDNVWREFEELHAWIGKGSVKPLIRRHRQFQPTSLHQFCNLSTGMALTPMCRVSCWAMKTLAFDESRSS